MIRIKDNIDLEILKNFGFKYDDNKGQWKFCERNIDGSTYVYINVWNNKIVYRQDKESDTECLTKIYELTMAGLIEKLTTMKELQREANHN